MLYIYVRVHYCNLSFFSPFLSLSLFSFFSLSLSLSLSPPPSPTLPLPPPSLQSPSSSRAPPSSVSGVPSSVGGASVGGGGLVPGGPPPPPLLYSANPALHLSSDIAALMPGIQGFGAHPLLGAGLGNYSPTQSGGEAPPPPPHHHSSEIGERDHRVGGPRSGSPNQDTD